MNSREAKEMTEFGMWAKISPSIKERIMEACNDGEYKISIPKHYLSSEDSIRLSELGYYIEFNGSDKFEPRYYISWYK